jgi:hypothetical protein
VGSYVEQVEGIHSIAIIDGTQQEYVQTMTTVQHHICNELQIHRSKGYITRKSTSCVSILPNATQCIYISAQSAYSRDLVIPY